MIRWQDKSVLHGVYGCCVTNLLSKEKNGCDRDYDGHHFYSDFGEEYWHGLNSKSVGK